MQAICRDFVFSCQSFASGRRTTLWLTTELYARQHEIWLFGTPRNERAPGAV